MKIQIVKVGFDNCYIVSQKNTILIDGGMPGEFNEFSSGLNNLGVDPNEIQNMVITHCHWDHIGCANKIKKMTGAKLIAHKYAKSAIEKGERVMPPSATVWGKIFGVFLNAWSKNFNLEPSEVDIVVDNEDFSLEDFGIDGKIVYTPGHSLGSITVLLASGDAFVGDMAMNGLPLTINPNLPIFAEDISLLKNSWKKLIDSGAKKIYPAHGKPFLIDKLIKKANL